jgi:ATP-dependent Clp protease ATP-binding subunit ClpB
MNGQNFTHKAQEAIVRAQELSRESQQKQIDALHLLLALLNQEDSIVLNLLERIGVDIEKLKEKTSNALEDISLISTPNTIGQFYLTQDMAKVLGVAQKNADKMKDDYISVEHLFLALLRVDTKAKEVLDNATFLKSEKGTTTLDYGKLNYEIALKELAKIRGGMRVTDRKPEAKYKIIEKYAFNLTESARKGDLDPVIGREKEIKRLMQILSRRTKNNPVLIGEAGVGKTAIVEGLAQRIVTNDVPDSLTDKELISLDLGALVAGTRYRGEFENRVKVLLKEVKKAGGKYLLFIDELHTLIGAGAAKGSIDASNLLKPALARGELKAIGATTLKEYQEYIEKDQALERRFQPVYVAEPSIEDAVLILRGIKEKYELHHGVKIKDSALITCAKLASRYISNRFLPDKAVDLMDEAMSALRLELESEPEKLEKLKKQINKLEIEQEAIKDEKAKKKRRKEIKKKLADLKEKEATLQTKWQTEKELITKIKDIKKKIEDARFEAEKASNGADLEKVAKIKYGQIPDLKKELKKSEKKLTRIQKKSSILKGEVTDEDIAKVVSQWTGIPVTKLLEGEQEKLKTMEKFLGKQVIGQEEALKAISNAVRRARAGLSEEGRPLGSFMFLGPTGVGKTETAKALAEFLFNDEDALIRFDMSEYMEKHNVSKMIGSPPGYVGHGESNQLTDKIRRRPYSIVLLDEIEKAHPEVFNILLQVLEDGRLTDSKGRVASFKNSILIMTSNVGSDIIAQKTAFGFVGQNGKQAKREELEERVKGALKKEFKPEFLNRIDDIVIFDYLSREDIRKIVDLEMDKVIKRLASKDIELKITKKGKKFIAEKGFDQKLGARPLKRVIQKKILDPLAMKVISGDVKANSKVTVSTKNNKISFRIVDKRK